MTEFDVENTKNFNFLLAAWHSRGCKVFIDKHILLLFIELSTELITVVVNAAKFRHNFH